MKLRNQIVNYFVSPAIKEGDNPRVFKSAVTVNVNTALELLNRQLKYHGRPADLKQLLHVCFDIDSEVIYLPNSTVGFSQEEIRPLLDAVRLRVTKDYGNYAMRPPIEGSPFSSLRLRSINSFSHASDFIRKHYENKIFKDLPVIEANLEKMPGTLKSLPKMFQEHDDFMGTYIGTSFARSITFIDEVDNQGNKRDRPRTLLRQPTPFILLNTSQKTEQTGSTKETIVLTSYRDYLEDKQSASKERYISDDLSRFADIYAIKRQLYLGFPFEEVSVYLLDYVKDFPNLIDRIQRLMSAAQSLEEEGYGNPAINPYYLAFRVDLENFPISLKSLLNPETGKIDPSGQMPHFRILDYDPDTSFILIETPAFVSSNVCKNVLKAKSEPFISKYNPLRNTIDVKTRASTYKLMEQYPKQLNQVKDFVKAEIESKEKTDELDFRTAPDGLFSGNPEIFELRRVSDYFYAHDFIKKMCEEQNVPFDDFNIVIGPIEQLMGRGSQGGFIDKHLWDKNGMPLPMEISKGLYISPPIIFINSITTPSYADQTDTLIHEYRHYVYSKQFPYRVPKYKDLGKAVGDEALRQWYFYFTDPDEREAHIQEIKYQILLGKSVDEIIRDKVGGAITTDNYPIALKFRELVNEATSQIEEEESE